jgi:hypothetical protein
MSELQKVQPGQKLRITARTFNAMIDAARTHQEGQRNLDRTSLFSERPNGIVSVKNASGGDRDRFDILGLEGPIIGPADNLVEFKNRVTFDGAVPRMPDHTGRFAVLLEPLAAGRIGLGLVSGIVACRINVLHIRHRYVEVDPGAFHPETALSGSGQILYRESGLGLRWSVLRLGPVEGRQALGVLDEQLDYRSSAMMSVWEGTPLSEFDTGVNIRVYDWLLCPGDFLEAGLHVVASEFYAGHWYVTSAQPPCSS